MIVITGASGQLGQLVIEGLLEKVPAGQIVAAVRDPAKASALAARGVVVRRADYNDPASLDAAFDGAQKVLLISSSEIGQRDAQHRNVVDAAKRAQVKLLAYTSVLRADTSRLGLAAEHVATEQAIRASGLPFSFLRNGWYYENFSSRIQAGAAHGTVVGSSGNGRIAAAARADYAAAAVAVLTAAAPEPVYELGGSAPFTLAELAAEVARQSGREAAYQDLPQAEFKKVLLGLGVPEVYAELISDSDAAAAGGALDDNTRTLERLIGRAPRTLADAVKAAL
ncbi:NmrA family NAD(P)-binding protein [Pseudoduganella sp. RAF19]|uniref:NmrA family NAD(P)-binding protein n=2 Tax=unclassified Pseudoduganella TaxID=2637179 RepID=UPI003F9C7901